MSFESDVTAAVQRMFSHTKTVVQKNLLAAVKEGKLTLDKDKVAGVNLLVTSSIDEAFRTSAKEVSKVLEVKHKK